MKTQAQKFCKEYNTLESDIDRILASQVNNLYHAIDGEHPLTFEFDDGSQFRFLADDEGVASELVRVIK